MHARVFASGLLVLDPEARWPVSRPYIALDLEYDTLRDKGLIWLTGAAVVDGTDAEHHSWWADTPDEERAALTGLAALLCEYPELPVVTWAGRGADIPQIRAACARLGLPAVTAQVSARHFDAYQWALGSVRLPIVSLGLKDVSG